MIDGVSSQPFSATTMPPIAKPAISYKENVIELSRKQFAAPRAEVEKRITEQLTTPITPKPEKSDKKQDNNLNKTNNFSGNNFNHANNNNRSNNVKENKEVKNGNHLNALRSTLAGVLGESDLAVPPIKEEKKILQEEIAPKIEPKGEQVNLINDDKKHPFQPKKNNFVKKEDHSNHKNDFKKPLPQENGEANSHRNALAEVLKKLQQKDGVDEKPEQSIKKDIPKEEVVEKKNVSNDELRAMLHVDEENS
jgi:hypothetical protein